MGGHRAAGGGGAEGREEREREKGREREKRGKERERGRERGGRGVVGGGGVCRGSVRWGEAGGGGLWVGGAPGELGGWLGAGEGGPQERGEERERGRERGREREKRRERKGGRRRRLAGAGAGGGGAGGGSPTLGVGRRRPSPAAGRSPATEKILGGKCNVRFYNEQFGGTYNVPISPPIQGNSTTEPPSKSPPTITGGNNSLANPDPNGKLSSTSRTVVFVIVPILVLVTLLAIGCTILLYKRTKKAAHDIDRSKSLESVHFELQTIKEATDDFSGANKLGQGGFGSVYKGRLSNSQEIGVKRFCLEASERLLIYEFLGNDSLDSFIFDPIRCTELTWKLRYKIICGIAWEILYLHEDSKHRIIHRDLRASNVLLDENMNPKISDFGMARLFVVDQSEADARRHMGTYNVLIMFWSCIGYMAPEYASHGCFSAKSDLFSFGVLILELVSGKQNSWWDSSGDLVHLLSYTWRIWKEGNASKLIDSTVLGGEGSRSSEIMRCIHIGLLCVQESAEQRPTMSSVVLMLTSHSTTLPLPSRPAFFMYNNTLAGPNSGKTEPDSGETKSKQSVTTERTTYSSIS
ncbi:hypothetical protein TIFTF001_022524 [Ficus carica]|uniref:Protein kinase domain-containing protein n=1 Tax=Ficus carica TaxID=3494 RepID=A0AA88DFK8_FICCA|nr:hypothetical protein TIFTF001_022524 [Ficus carica]